MKIEETHGKNQTSHIKWYAPDSYSTEYMVTLCHNKKTCGRIILDSLEQMAEVKKAIGFDFTILPK